MYNTVSSLTWLMEGQTTFKSIHQDHSIMLTTISIRITIISTPLVSWQNHYQQLNLIPKNPNPECIMVISKIATSN